MGVSSPELIKSKDKEPEEIERKFLVASLPPEINLHELRGEHIEQGYLANGSGKNTVRLRNKEGKYSQTVKSRRPGDKPIKRTEREIDLTGKQFDTLWPVTEGRRIEKTRYRIPYADAVIELDVFEGANVGHMLAEVEFPTEAEAEEFIPPEWFGTDVTADGRYGNASIAKNGFPTPDVHPAQLVIDFFESSFGAPDAPPIEAIAA